MAFERYELWNTHTLLAVMQDTDQPQNYWLDLLFPNVITSEDEYIDLEKIPTNGRKLAPFVAPLAQGRPIYEEGSRMARFKPAYVKALDPITPTRVITKRPGTLLSAGTTSPGARYNAIKADILAYHRLAVERLWEYMAAKAIIESAVRIEGDDSPARLIDFGRASGHSIVLGVGARWGDSGVSILDNIQTWIDTMTDAEFGGAPNRITIGSDVWKVMRKNAEILDLMDLNKRGSNVALERGLVAGNTEARYVGTLGIGLDVYVYNDWYTIAGTVTRFMSSKDVVLTGPQVQGYRCFGMIQDLHAAFNALPIFPRNFVPTNDPAIEHILTQSAPLMVPVNPNATFRATVLA
jgi:hypothetical protein